jgi:hypothetical protein
VEAPGLFFRKNSDIFIMPQARLNLKMCFMDLIVGIEYKKMQRSNFANNSEKCKYVLKK